MKSDKILPIFLPRRIAHQFNVIRAPEECRDDVSGERVFVPLVVEALLD